MINEAISNMKMVTDGDLNRRLAPDLYLGVVSFLRGSRRMSLAKKSKSLGSCVMKAITRKAACDMSVSIENFGIGFSFGM